MPLFGSISPEIVRRARGLNLVMAAIALSNTVCLDRVIKAGKERGPQVSVLQAYTRILHAD